ncbi:MAG: DNA translocase FtsK [Planctomycetota bacterium]|nr:DNA translocase FtsK [Planctomycetota bacterium]
MADSPRKVRASGGRSALTLFTLILLLGAWAFTAASMIGFDPSDAPGHVVWPSNDPTANWCGPFGATVAYALFKLLGSGAWVLLMLLGVALTVAALGVPLRQAFIRMIGLIMLAASVSGMQALAFPDSGSMPGLAGGLVGTVSAAELGVRFGPFGAGIVLLVMGLVGAVVAMDHVVIAALGWTWDLTRERGVPAAKVVGAAAGGAAMTAGEAVARASGTMMSRLWARAFPPKKKTRGYRRDDVSDDPPASGRRTRQPAAPAPDPAALDIDDPDAAPIPLADADVEAKPSAAKSAAKTPRPAPSDDDADEREDDDDLPGAAQVYTEEALREKIAKLPVVFGQKDKVVATEADLVEMRGLGAASGAAGPEPEQPVKEYAFPGLDLLENPEENFNVKLEEYVREQATALESALRQYRIDGEVVGIESGPVITLFDVRLAPGTKVAALQAVSSDIARSLKAVNIRIVPNQAGRDTVGVEVPNSTKEKVRLKELMGKTEKFSSMKLPMFLGKDASGEALIEDLTKMPHMLIAGTTGSGKSVCMNTIIMGFLYTKKPSELKMVLVDPKMVEMSQFKDIPHLMCPVVTEMSKAAAILEWACVKMDERYELLAEAGCRDIASYNDLGWDELKDRMRPKTPEEEARIPRKLPYMVFIIDELADLMMTNKEVEGHIIRIAQKARAVGIHLILATQRPQANVVTGLIKSNMPCRITFKVASGMDSRIVLDQKGGELLLGHGDMLVLSPRSSKLTRAQGTLVDDLEIRRVVRFMRDVAGPSFERSLLQIRSGAPVEGTGLGNLSDEERLLQSKNNSSASLAAAQEDPLFPRAVEIVLETRRGSVSLLQRRLAIGYTRASRLIDLMGIAGIISDHKGSVARDVLITIEDWDRMKQLAAEEARAKGLASVFTGDAPTGEPGAEAPGPLFTAPDGGAMPASITSEDDRFDDAFQEEAEDPPFRN